MRLIIFFLLRLTKRSIMLVIFCCTIDSFPIETRNKLKNGPPPSLRMKLNVPTSLNSFKIASFFTFVPIPALLPVVQICMFSQKFYFTLPTITAMSASGIHAAVCCYDYKTTARQKIDHILGKQIASKTV